MRNIFNSFKKTSVAERGSDESVRNLIDWRDRNEPELTGDNASIAFVTHTGRKLTVPEVSEVLLKHIRAEVFTNKSNGKSQTRYISFVNGSTDFDKERLPGSNKLLQASDIKRGTVLGIHDTKEEAIQTFLNHLRTGNRMGGQDEISAPVRADVTPSEARARALGQDIADMDRYYCTSSGLARLKERVVSAAKDFDAAGTHYERTKGAAGAVKGMRNIVDLAYAALNNLSVVKNRLSEAAAKAVVIDRHNGIGKNGKPQPGFPMGTETVRGGHIITVQKHDDPGGEERLYVLSHHSDEYEKAYPGVKFLRLAQESRRNTSPVSTFPSDNAKKFPIEPVQFDMATGGASYPTVSPSADYTIDPFQILGRGVGTQIDLGPYTGTITDIEMPTKIFKRT